MGLATGCGLFTLPAAVPSPVEPAAGTVTQAAAPPQPAVPVTEPTASTPPPASSPTAPPNQAALPSGALAFGINEALAVPQAWVRNGLLTHAQEVEKIRQDAELTVSLGARIVRANSSVYPYTSHHALRKAGWSWQRIDAWVRVANAADLDILMVVGPWPGNQTGAYTRQYLPQDLKAYARYLTRLVERYDGDGVDDMPGLTRPIKHWEVDNEPDLHNSTPPKGKQHLDPTHFETPAEYAQILLLSSRVIHQTDPEAVVLSGGLFRPHAHQGRKYLEQVLSTPGVLEAFDVLSLHTYFSHDDLTVPEKTLATARQLAPGKPVWITETSVPSAGKDGHLNEQWQARMVGAVYGVFLAGGVQRVFWHTLSDPPHAKHHSKRSGFSTNSLMKGLGGARSPSAQAHQARIDMPRETKPAGEVYRRLSTHLRTVDLADVKEVPARGGRLLWTGQGWLAFWGRPVVPKGAAEVENLLTGQRRAPGTTVEAPAWITAASTDAQPPATPGSSPGDRDPDAKPDNPPESGM